MQITVKKYGYNLPISRELWVEGVAMRWHYFRGAELYPPEAQIADRKLMLQEGYGLGRIGPRVALP